MNKSKTTVTVTTKTTTELKITEKEIRMKFNIPSYAVVEFVAPVQLYSGETCELEEGLRAVWTDTKTETKDE